MNIEKYPILSTVDDPSDLRRLNDKDTDTLADEIRNFLVDNVSRTGGHLASNLGVVELTLALHRVLETPKDKIIWDVGHQCYVHKLITGRRDCFDTLRKPGGLSGFTKRSESEYDPFGAGHSSTSVSAALGIAEAERLRGGDAYTVAVVGDGAFTGGMIHEALNNCDENRGLRLIIIINENEMSISKNTGRFANSISKIRTRPSYFRTKAATRGFLSKIPLFGKPLVSGITKTKKSLKNLLYGSNYFEDLGLYYIGPIDGNDRVMVENMLREAKKCNDSVVLHVKTVKGKGYAPAEKTPDAFHAVPPAGSVGRNGFSSEFGKYLCKSAVEDKRICAITAAMGRGTGLLDFQNKFPERFFDVGIAEEHAVTFAAGLASNGMRPVCAIYSTFLQRSYDSLIHDVSLQNLPVLFAIDRAGLNSSDGATHHGIFDVAFLSEIPDMAIYTPATYAAMTSAFDEARRLEVPAAVRYPNAAEDPRVIDAFYGNVLPLKPGVRLFGLEDPGHTDAVIFVHGRMAATALDVKDELRKRGIRCGIVLCEYIKPYRKLAEEVKALFDSLNGDSLVVFLEEEIRSGGFGMNLSDVLVQRGLLSSDRLEIIATDDDFVIPTYGKTVFEAAGIDKDSVAAKITSRVSMSSEVKL
ncbi:MAG: 1-deoxy-D-xylulose-5-phosphate synthase [Clostridia bacterium]|nr:1-deoxy-D-xylulose-5-phosphate synthase [Clostridia bacterium]